jgi:hypothetical protein
MTLLAAAAAAAATIATFRWNRTSYTYIYRPIALEAGIAAAAECFSGLNCYRKRFNLAPDFLQQ